MNSKLKTIKQSPLKKVAQSGSIKNVYEPPLLAAMQKNGHLFDYYE